jgi:hypothetical protein
MESSTIVPTPLILTRNIPLPPFYSKLPSSVCSSPCYRIHADTFSAAFLELCYSPRFIKVGLFINSSKFSLKGTVPYFEQFVSYLSVLIMNLAHFGSACHGLVKKLPSPV